MSEHRNYRRQVSFVTNELLRNLLANHSYFVSFQVLVRKQKKPGPLPNDDYAKDGGEKLLLRCIAFYLRIPTESLKSRNRNASSSW